MAKRFTVETIFKGIDKMSAPITKMQNKMNRIARSMKNIGNGMKDTGKKISANIGAPLALIGGAIFKTAKDFDLFMNMVEAKSTIVGTSLAQLRAQALELGKTTKYSHIEVAEGMNFLAQAGFNTEEIFKSIKPVLDLATASSSELGETADWLSNIMGGFRKSADEAEQVASILAVTTAKSNVNLEQLAETFSKMGPIARKYGVSMEEAAAATGFLGNIGIQEEAGTVLKNMFLNLSTGSKAVTTALDSIGVKASMANGKLRPFTDILLDMSKALPGKTEVQQMNVLNEVLGLRAIAGGSAMIDDLTSKNGKFEELTAILKKVDPSNLEEMVTVMRKGAVGPFDDMVSAIQGLGQAFGDAGLTETITSIVLKITDLARKLSDLNPKTMKIISIIGLLFIALGPVLVILGQLTVALASLPAAIAAVSAAMLRLNIVMTPAFASMLLSVALFVAGVAALMLLFDQWENIQRDWSFIFSSEGLDALVAGLKELVSLDSLIAKSPVLNYLFGKADGEEPTTKKEANKEPLVPVNSPVQRTANIINENNTTNSAEITIKDNSGKAAVTKGGDFKGFNFQSSGAWYHGGVN